jgi:hypothetical protein
MACGALILTLMTTLLLELSTPYMPYYATTSHSHDPVTTVMYLTNSLTLQLRFLHCAPAVPLG